MTRIAALLAVATMAVAPALPASAQQPQQDPQRPAADKPAIDRPAAAPTTPPAPASATAPATTPAGSQQVLVGSDSLVGSTVRDSQGKNIGKVSRLMINPADGRIANLVIETGGTLGIGGNTVSLPWDAVKVGQDGGKLIVTASQMLDSAPGRPADQPATRR